MRILVTGGAGFIGANLVHHLLELGGEVMVVDDLSTGKIENLDPRAGFRKLDILSDSFVDVVCDFGPDVIVHLAAQASVAQSVANPEETLAINVEGTRNVVRAALACKAERLVFASTAAVYGNPEHTPLREDSALRPINPYGASKLAAEQLIEEELYNSAVDYAIVRFSNVYGPRQDAAGEGGVVAVFCDRLSKEKAPVIHGDGQQVRDFIYVADVVNALTSTIGGDIEFKCAQDIQPGRFNISTGQPVTVEQLLNALRMFASFYGMPEYGEAREGDIRVSTLDPSRARETFEWAAGVSLDKGLEATWTWYMAQNSQHAN